MITKLLGLVTSAASWQKYVALISAITGLVFGAITWHQSQLDEAFDNGYDKAKLEVETQYNKDLLDAQAKYQKEIKELVDNHNAEVALAIEEVDQYWQDFYKKKEDKLTSEFEKKLEAQRIKNEANNITDKLNPDTLRLLKQSYSQFSPPSYFRKDGVE